MRNWTQLRETYKAILEEELLRGRSAILRQAELAKRGNPNAVKSILRKEKVGKMTEPKERKSNEGSKERKSNTGYSSFSVETDLERAERKASSGFANYPKRWAGMLRNVTINQLKQAHEKKDAIQAKDGFRPRESVMREITAELAAAKQKRTAAQKRARRGV